MRRRHSRSDAFSSGSQTFGLIEVGGGVRNSPAGARSRIEVVPETPTISVTKPIGGCFLFLLVAVATAAAGQCENFEILAKPNERAAAELVASLGLGPTGQWAAGMVVLNGCGGKPGDAAAAATWFRRAAEQGYAGGQSALGWLYSTGRGVPLNYRAAAQWLRRAAEQGDAFGQRLLGFLYAFGWGVPQDYVVAHQWLNLAAASGDELAREGRDSLAADMTRDQLEAAQRAAREWTALRERN